MALPTLSQYSAYKWLYCFGTSSNGGFGQFATPAGLFPILTHFTQFRITHLLETFFRLLFQQKGI